MSNTQSLVLLALLPLLFAAGFYCGGRWVWRGMRDKPVEFAERMQSRITSARGVDDDVKNAWLDLSKRLRQLKKIQS